MSRAVLKVENLGKKYLLGGSHSLSIADLVRSAFRNNKTQAEEFWALNDISFHVQAGETIGIIGKNGAGKSTLLKILSKITHPTTGRFEMEGRVSSLLEVGTGFHPELSGRENVFLNGTILGMTRKEIRSKFDEIVEFSGVSKFIDTPVKHYSSGMYVRLAFSVAAHLEPEILIIDEVLAVGDAEFQKRCLGKMEEVAEQGRTVLFVSHSMGAIENLCKRVICLEGGHCAMDTTNVSAAINYYLFGKDQKHSNTLKLDVSNEYFDLTSAQIVTADYKTNSSKLNESFSVVLQGEVHRIDPALNIGIAIYDERRNIVFYSFSGDAALELKQGNFQLEVEIPPFLLNTGDYELEVISDIRFRKFLIEPGQGIRMKFSINAGIPWQNRRGGVIAPKLNWTLQCDQ